MRLPREDELIAAATQARSNAHAPWSGFRVGAAVLDDQGNIRAGCNVENASFGATLCAERGAVSAAIALGAKELLACVIVTDAAEVTPPCGICRQVLAEFGPSMQVLSVNLQGTRKIWSLDELLPHAFTRSSF